MLGRHAIGGHGQAEHVRNMVGPPPRHSVDVGPELAGGQ